MAKKLLFGFLDKRPLIWFHYVLLTGVLFGAFFLLNKIGFIEIDSQLSTSSWIFLFIWYYLFISLGDQIIHRVLNVD